MAKYLYLFVILCFGTCSLACDLMVTTSSMYYGRMDGIYQEDRKWGRYHDVCGSNRTFRQVGVQPSKQMLLLRENPTRWQEDANWYITRAIIKSCLMRRLLAMGESQQPAPSPQEVDKWIPRWGGSPTHSNIKMNVTCASPVPQTIRLNMGSALNDPANGLLTFSCWNNGRPQYHRYSDYTGERLMLSFSGRGWCISDGLSGDLRCSSYIRSWAILPTDITGSWKTCVSDRCTKRTITITEDNNIDTTTAVLCNIFNCNPTPRLSTTDWWKGISTSTTTRIPNTADWWWNSKYPDLTPLPITTDWWKYPGTTTTAWWNNLYPTTTTSSTFWDEGRRTYNIWRVVLTILGVTLASTLIVVLCVIKLRKAPKQNNLTALDNSKPPVEPNVYVTSGEMMTEKAKLERHYQVEKHGLI